MKILLIRHARAEERAGLVAARGDQARRLTAGGRRDMRRAAAGLVSVAPKIDLLASSPLVRARETAEIVARVLDGPEPVELSPLAPGGSRKELLAWLAGQPAEATIALVGHEPNLSGFASWLLSGNDSSFIELKKGAACLVELEGRPVAGRGRLIWALAPRQLRRLADA